MRIGLLISEFNDKDEFDLCAGADIAAGDLGVELVIFPGKYIITDKTLDTDFPYKYQHQAVYDYCIDAGFDGLIIDIQKIGKNAPILKREQFLNQFGKKPLLTVTETEGFEHIRCEENISYFERGFLAIEQIIKLISGNDVKAHRTELPKFTEDDYRDAFKRLTGITGIIINDECIDDYEVGTKKVIAEGLNNYEAYILEEPKECSLKKGWKIPKHCKILFSIHDGKADKTVNNLDREVCNIFSETNIKGTKIIRNFFNKTMQLGFIITDFNKDFRTGFFDDMLVNLVSAGNRIYYLNNYLKNIEEELSECQEELAREGSVLDHIGENDYLTDLPNRRGFFAKAYDYLKDNFKEGTYAVVSYIDMDSLKNINAIHGHDEGDHAVKRVANILQEVFGKESICGRIRGDEFAVIQVTEEEDKAEVLRIEMARQNNKLFLENTKYLNHLIYSICEFGYDESLSLREMLKETDDNLKNMRRMEMTGK